MRVLVATDGSDPAAIACELAGEVAVRVGGSVRVVAVVPPKHDLFAGLWPATGVVPPDALARIAADSLRDRLADEVARFDPGIRPSSALLHGRVDEAIVAEAVRWGADLIIVGSRGRGAIASVLLGSVSLGVVDRSPIAALVARRPTISRVVVGTDGSAGAEAAVDLVAGSPLFAEATITVAGVVRSPNPWWIASTVLETETRDAVVQAYDAAFEQRRLVVDAAVKRLRAAGRKVACRYREGDPADELGHEAVASDADLVVVGSHGGTIGAGPEPESVARRVLEYAPCSVLMVVPPAPATSADAADRDRVDRLQALPEVVLSR